MKKEITTDEHRLEQMEPNKKKLPEGWEWKKLGEVCEVIGGGTPSKKVKEFYNGNIPWATVRDMQGEIIQKTECKITEEAVKKSSTNIIPKNNVIIATRVGLGKVCLLNKDTAINQDLRGIIPKNNNYLYVPFLFRWFKSISNRIIEEGTGATVKGVKLPFIKDLSIPLPPLSEQKRIVAILDEAFAAIDKARANAEKNLANAKELFESYLNGIFANPREDWEEKKLGEICEFVRGPFGGSLKKSIFRPSGYAVYEQQHAINNQFENIRYFIDEIKFNKMKRFELKAGDLIMSCSGTMGRTAIVPETFHKGIINQALLKLTPQNSLSVHFLKLWMESNDFLKQIAKHSQGAAIKNVSSVKTLKNIRLKLPSMKTQNEIIEKTDSFSGITIRLKEIYQKKISAFEDLKKSFLKKAFEGEL